MTQLEQLKRNLKGYVSRFYLNQLIKGAILTLLISGSFWLTIALLEYFGNFSESTRMVLFFSFLSLALALIVFRVLIPLGRMSGIVKGKDEYQAANEIGRSLNPVEDKLVNLLNLQSQTKNTENKLVLASLDQKAIGLNRFNFSEVIDFRDTLGWLKYLIAPVVVFAALTIWDPAIIGESSKRVFAFDQSFIPPAPFSFEIENQTMQVAEGSDFTLQVKTSGSQLPEHVFIESGDTRIRMKKAGLGSFEYTYDNVSSSVAFKLSAAGVRSSDLKIEVLPLPKLLRNRAYVDYPDYTGLKDEELLNRSQVKVPEGSKLKWSFDLKNVSTASVYSNQLNEVELSNTDGPFQFEASIRNDEELNLIMKNTSGLVDSSKISVFAIRDAVPAITAKEMQDSTVTEVKYFSGEISDDYGFRSLMFHANVLSEKGVERMIKKRIAISTENVEQQFNFIFSIDTIAMQPEETLEYYFEVWDNDAVNGSKSSRSMVWKYEVPSLTELSKKNDEQADKSKSSMKNQLNELDKVNKDLDQFRKEMLQKKNADWQDKERMKELLDKQKEMMNKLMNKADEQRKQNELNNRFMEYSEELLQKQEQIQEMFDNLFDEEFKEKYKEYQELLEKMNKDQMLDKMEDMKLDNEKLEKELDRTLELFKQLEFDKKLEETINKTDELAKKQEELQEKTEDKSNNLDDLKKEQDKLGEEMKDLQKELDKLEELNKDLEEPTDMPSAEEESKEGKESMEESSQEMDKKNRKKSQDQQEKAKDALNKISKKLSDFKKEESEEQHAEDLDDMRQLLENLIDLSHAQEAVMEDLKTTSARDPQYVSLAKRQKDIIDDSKVVEDSLLALSKRVPMISRTLNDEMSEVKHNMDKALSNMTDQPPNQEQRYREMATVNQQLSMTSLNNLAILFDNIIKQMQDDMSSKMKGDGQCNKPGSGKGSKPSAAEMKKTQEALNKQIEKLKEAMEKGEKPNGKKPGNKPGMGQGGMSKELARMAAQQGAIREQLRQLSNSIEKEGGQPGGQMKELQKLMEQTEEDLLYQNISRQTLDRQQDILTKLLESEKAEREREMDKKRESKTAQDSYEVPTDIWEKYSLEKQKELELYKTLPPNLKPYYRKEVNRYFSGFQN